MLDLGRSLVSDAKLAASLRHFTSGAFALPFESSRHAGASAGGGQSGKARKAQKAQKPAHDQQI